MVGDLPAGVLLALVVVRAEVLVTRAGGGQQLVVDLQLGVPERDLGFDLAAAAGQPPVAAPSSIVDEGYSAANGLATGACPGQGPGAPPSPPGNLS